MLTPYRRTLPSLQSILLIGLLCLSVHGASDAKTRPTQASKARLISPQVSDTDPALPPGVRRITTVEGITEYRLSNGLKILLFPDQSKPTITVNMTYLVGSRHENYGETGMAHLLEHLLFKGTPSNPKIDVDFNRRGMRSNGTTWLDRTNYYELFQASDTNLKWAIDMEADRMLHSFIAKKDLDSEMTVVRNEMENGENSPFSVLIKRMQSVAYDWHSYGRSTIGNRSDVENVRIENLHAFYRTWYQPDNAVLLVAGKFSEARALQWIAAAFGKHPKPQRALPPAWTEEPVQDGERSFVVRRQGDLQILALAYKIPSALHPDSDAIQVAAEVLSDTPSGRLHQQLVTSGQAAQVFSYGLTGVAPGLQMVGAVVPLGAPIAPVQEALIAATESLSRTPPTEEELARVKRSFSNQLEKVLNDHEQIGVAMSEAIALGDWRIIFKGRDDLVRLSAADVASAAGRYFRRDNRVAGSFLPEDAPQRASIPAAPSITKLMADFKPRQRTDTAEAFDPSQANIAARTLRKKIGGIDLALLAKKTRGATVAVALNLHWGERQSLFGKRAVGDLTAAMLMRGNRAYNRQELADAFANLNISGDLFRFETTRANLPAALALVAQVLKEPTFPANEFQELVRLSITGLEANRKDPATLAQEALNAHFNPYPVGDWQAPQSTEDAIAAIKAVSLAQVQAFHAEFYGASHAELSIVGDHDPAAILPLIETHFASWQSKAAYVRLEERSRMVVPLRLHINTPDKENGHYSARLNLTLRDTDPEFPALLVANYMLGGDAGLNSRLMERVRQKDGLSYGIGSELQVGSLESVSSLHIGGIAAPQNLAAVAQAVLEEVNKARQTGFSASEVARAKSGILQTRHQNRAQDSVLAAGWVAALHLQRSFSFSKALEDQIRALTTEQINTAFQRLIDPQNLSVVTAGDNAKATAQRENGKPQRR